MTMTAGVTPKGEGIEGIAWDILGQTYVPKQLCENSFSWHATFPAGTFVPPHIHPTQDEFIYVLGGRFDLFLDGSEAVANAGDFIRLPMGQAHGIFNKTDSDVTCLFWVTPSRKLYDLFNKIDRLTDPEEVVRISADHEVNFLPPPD